MQTYVSANIPLNTRTLWYKELSDVCRRQFHTKMNGHLHITLAFIEDTNDANLVAEALGKVLEGREMPALNFDKLDVFTGQHKKKQIIHLTCSNPPEEFMRIVRDVRVTIENTGHRLNTGFKLHMTLAEINPDIKIETVRDALRGIDFKGIRLTPSRPVYIERSKHTAIKTY